MYNEKLSTDIPTKTVDLMRGGTWSVIPAQRPERFDYEAVLQAYVPSGIPTDTWSADLGPFVVDQISRIGGLTRDEVWRYSRTLARFMQRVRRNGHPLDVELLTPTNIEHFVSTVGGSDRTKATIRSDLDRLGRALTRTAPWEPPPSRFTPSLRPPPYAKSEFRSIRRDSRNQRTARITQGARGIVALCAGAGVRPGELCLVRSDSIEPTDSGVLVHIGGRNPRSVPAQEWAWQELVDLARTAAGSWVCGGRSAGKNYASSMAASIRLHSGARLQPSRLRSTWIVSRMRDQTPLLELLRQSGLMLPGSLDDYMPYLAEKE